jgi:predicted dehydrogenase
MIGTGGISASHLDAYRTAGWEVAALWNRTRSKAEAKAAEYCPDARIEDDWQAMLPIARSTWSTSRSTPSTARRSSRRR